jgi:hypothetical protein
MYNTCRVGEETVGVGVESRPSLACEGLSFLTGVEPRMLLFLLGILDVRVIVGRRSCKQTAPQPVVVWMGSKWRRDDRTAPHEDRPSTNTIYVRVR